MLVFGAIVILGVLVGIFCLPNSGRETAELVSTESTAVMAQSPPTHVAMPVDNTVPIAEIKPPAEPPAPVSKSEELFRKALTLQGLREKFDCLIEAHRIDPAGRWGGEAAAEIGNLCKPTDPVRAKE